MDGNPGFYHLEGGLPLLNQFSKATQFILSQAHWSLESSFGEWELNVSIYLERKVRDKDTLGQLVLYMWIDIKRWPPI